VGHYDPEWRIGEEWLGFIATVTSYCGISSVADPYVSLQTLEVFFCKDVPDKTVSLFSMKTSVVRYDPG
jgi:hypothetical protein